MRLCVVVVHIGVNDLLIFRNGAAVFALCLQAFAVFVGLFGVFQRLNAVELIVETDVREQLLQAVEQFIGAVVVRFAFIVSVDDRRRPKRVRPLKAWEVPAPQRNNRKRQARG